jgi:hypothetical protein
MKGAHLCNRLIASTELTSMGTQPIWIKRILEWMFPGDQLRTSFEMIGVFALIVFYGALRAKIWQRHGGSSVFLTKQRFQTLFGKKQDVNE